MSRDTTPAATRARTALYRRMSSERRCEIAATMSVATREIALDGIRTRHPDYDEATAKLALFRLLVGDALFRRAWPNSPLIDP